ncbi:hypothetical protein F3K02_16540 [Hydrogenophaga sp. D2P1]|uniref:Uncharacterized protein n=1 Tax=Hydrogenophaga aromaticivorans TaxID=2610898 RepID=A0A7Y8GZK3_9BURK|nr:hypothetical protein [Hydrogenophaga aromaticivorans]NWF46848.1 hypothetical protein [Hydrogenophaga aromaticivorans]
MTQHSSTVVQQATCNEWTMARELAQEHGVLMRQIGGLQSRCTELLRSSSSRVAALEGENLRLRAELVLLRTSVFWGLGAATVLRRRSPAVRSRPPVEAGAREAQAVICQTGCVGHAHPWLDAEGQCRRSGQACDRVGDDAEALRS